MRILILVAPLVVLPLIVTIVLYTYGGARLVLLGYAVFGALVSLLAGILGLAVSPKIMADFTAFCFLGLGIFSLIFIARELGPLRQGSRTEATELPLRGVEREKTP